MAWSDVCWYLQDNLGSARDLAALIAALDGLGVDWRAVAVVPFSDEEPDAPTDRRAIFYGSTTLIKNVARAGRWRPGVFFDEPRFEFEALLGGYGPHLLNGDSEVLSVRELVARPLDPERLSFVRPAADLKEFSGEVMSGAEIAAWREGLEGSVGPLSLETRVQVAAPKSLLREWRCVLVEGRVVASSRYRTGRRLDVSAQVPPEVVAFSEEMARRYAPAPVFTLDVGEIAEGLRVVETNCFHSSGFYACDARAIARAVSAYVARDR